jgi:hypothetical protein
MLFVCRRPPACAKGSPGRQSYQIGPQLGILRHQQKEAELHRISQNVFRTHRGCFKGTRRFPGIIEGSCVTVRCIWSIFEASKKIGKRDLLRK